MSRTLLVITTYNQSKYTRLCFESLKTIEKDISTYIKNIGNSKNTILYNRWFSEKQYRDKIAHSLGFLNRDIGMNDISKYGRGSSFDLREKFHGNAASMDVLNRWKNEIENDLTNLTNIWNSIKDKAINSIAPSIIHQESDIIKIKEVMDRAIEYLKVPFKTDVALGASWGNAKE